MAPLEGAFPMVKSTWSNYIRGSHAYQLTKKTYLLKQAIRNRNYEIYKTGLNLMNLFQGLQHIQNKYYD